MRRIRNHRQRAQLSPVTGGGNGDPTPTGQDPLSALVALLARQTARELLEAPPGAGTGSASKETDGSTFAVVPGAGASGEVDTTS